MHTKNHKNPCSTGGVAVNFSAAARLKYKENIRELHKLLKIITAAFFQKV